MLNQKLLLYFLILNIHNLFSAGPLCISLGDACGPALMLRRLGLRTEAFPFDWIISPFQALHESLHTNFKFFLTDLTIRQLKNGVIDYYGFTFIHDWPTIKDPKIDALNSDFVTHAVLNPEWEKALPLVKEKYHRRIRRLAEVCSGNRKIIFLRQIGGAPAGPLSLKEEAVQLHSFFKKTYPQLNFVLVMITADQELASEWGIPGIKNLFLSRWDDSKTLGKLLAEIDPAFAFLG